MDWEDLALRSWVLEKNKQVIQMAKPLSGVSKELKMWKKPKARSRGKPLSGLQKEYNKFKK